MKNTISRAIRLCGTEQPDVVGRILKAGPMQVEFDNGQFRYLKVNGVEVLRALAFLVRDENWGTYTPQLSGLQLDQRADGFTVSFHAVCSRPGQEIGYDAKIEGDANGNLRFEGVAVPKTDFLTARTGFVVLHPLKGVAGQPVTVEHVDGRSVESKFPPLVDPIQPLLSIRALTHEVSPGLKATVRMEGDTFEMEDHRNWTDASFKTYVRPLALPWPYTLPAGEVVRQSVSITLTAGAPASVKSGAKSNAATRSTAAPAGPGSDIKLGAVLSRSGSAGLLRPPRGADDVVVGLGALSTQTLLPLGVGVPAEEIEPALQRIELLKLAAPRILQCHFDPRRKHGVPELRGYGKLAEQTGASVVLEAVVESVDQYADELQRLAALVKEAGLVLSGVAVCPVGDLKSVLPGGARPPAPPLEGLYAAARYAFPGVRLGGGMFSFFTELNRKRPPAQLLDFVMNTTCPIVHAADDRSVMETLEALPFQVNTARSYLGKTPQRVGPSAIGCRDNPHGATFTPNPDNLRVCLAKMDPRMRGVFGAAWTLGYIATFARAGIEALTIGAPTGPLGMIYRRSDYEQPYYDSLTAPSVYPLFHVISGITRGAGARLVDAACSDSQKVQYLAYRGKGGGTTLWLANLTTDVQSVQVSGGSQGAMIGALLDENTFEVATAKPREFQQSYKTMDRRVTLAPYAVAILAIAD